MAKIAVVEDDLDTSRLIGEALRESGHEVVSYFQPTADILQHLLTLKPDLVIMDARLNSPVTGWDIIEALAGNEAASRIPVIVCSGAADEIAQHREELERLGVPVLAKPFGLDDLDELVDQALSAGHARRK